MISFVRSSLTIFCLTSPGVSMMQQKCCESFQKKVRMTLQMCSLLMFFCVRIGKVLPPIRGAEENATLKYLNMTTVATFFSAITATTLQFSFAQTGTNLDNAVNFFWFLSLIFSVSSAINSLLGMTWRKSAM